MGVYKNLFSSSPKTVKKDVNRYTLRNLLNEAIFQYNNRGQTLFNSEDTSSYIKHGYVGNSDVYSIINYILHTVAQVEIDVKVINKRTGKLEDAQESDLAGVADKFIDSEFKKSVIGYKLVTGDAYIYGLSPDSGINRGKIRELDILPSQMVNIIAGTTEEPISGYALNIGDNSKKFLPEEVAHIKYWNPGLDNTQSLYGLSPLESAKILIEQSSAAQASNADAMSNQGPPFLLSKDNDEFEHSEAEDLSQSLTSKYFGIGKRNSVAPITNVSLKSIQLGLSPSDLKIIESQKLTFEMLCRVFRFPITLVDSNSATLDNMKVAERALYTNCVLPEINSLTSKLNSWMAPGYGEGFRFVLNTNNIEALQTSKSEQVEWLSKAWWLKINQKQEIMGIEKDPNMDFYAIPNSLRAVKDIDDMFLDQVSGMLTQVTDDR